MPYAPATDTSFFTRRGLVFAVIIALHVGMFYLLNSGLSHQIIDVVNESGKELTEGTAIDDARQGFDHTYSHGDR